MYSRRKKRKRDAKNETGKGEQSSTGEVPASAPGGDVPEQKKPPKPALPSSYARARWRHWFRIVTVVILIGLNIALLGSSIQSYLRGEPRPLGLELLSYSVVLLFDVIILFPSLVEADRVELTDEGIIVRTLFWKSTIGWSKIRSLRKPEYLTYAILRTPRAFYFIRKPDFKEFDDFMSKAQQMLDWARSE